MTNIQPTECIHGLLSNRACSTCGRLSTRGSVTLQPKEAWKKSWKEIEPETLDHLVTVIMCMLDEDTGELRDKHFGEVKEYIESWVKYRSLFVRDLLK